MKTMSGKMRKVASYLRSGKPITQAIAVQKFHAWRLAVIVNRLRNDYGWNVDSRIKRTAGSCHAVYHVGPYEAKRLAKLGDMAYIKGNYRGDNE